MLDITWNNKFPKKEAIPMFTQIGLKNFRTHKDSQVNLSDLTLIIGSNNSGKSNFLTGIHYISKLLGAFNPNKREFTYELRTNNYYPNRHSLSQMGEPIEFNCKWENKSCKIGYSLSIFPNASSSEQIHCTESLEYNEGTLIKKFSYGVDEKSKILFLRKKIFDLNFSFQNNIDDFFYSLSSFYYYNFQPSLLKGEAFNYIYSEGRAYPQQKKDYFKDLEERSRFPNIPSELGKEGGNLQDLLLFVKERDEETYNRFSGYLKRFVKNFNGLVDKENGLKWQFDMGTSNFPYYDPDKISDGLVKAAAVALLCSLRRPPALIMIEEVENGINQRKLTEFLSWLTHTSDNSSRTQFIITSHSPSVIREFSNRLDCVYNFHLREKDYVTRITNINDAMKPLVNMGTVEEESTFKREDGKEVITVKPYHLVELFYNGVLGEL